MLLLIFADHLYVGCGHAIFPDFLGGERPAGNVQGLQFGAQIFNRAAGVDQSAEGHVSADSAKTVKIGQFHSGPPPCDGAGTAKKCCGAGETIVSAASGRVKPAGALRSDG